LGDEVFRFAADGKMQVVDASANIARGKSRLGIRVIGEIHFQLAGGIQCQAGCAAAAGVGIARAVKVEQKGAGELLAGADARGGEFFLTLGGQLERDYGTANSGENVAGVTISVFVEARHRLVISFWSFGF